MFTTSGDMSCSPFSNISYISTFSCDTMYTNLS